MKTLIVYTVAIVIATHAATWFAETIEMSTTNTVTMQEDK